MAFRWLCAGAASAVLGVLGLLAVTMVGRAWPALGPSLLASARWSPPDGVYGAAAFAYGSAVTAGLALLFAVPVSVGVALFVTQVAPRPLARAAVAALDLLAVIPSVVIGLWGVLVLAPALIPVFEGLHATLGALPGIGAMFGAPSGGRSLLTAGFVLGVMITPIVTSLAREVIATTPPGLVESALALGATRWEMIRGAVLPHAAGGLVGAVMLGLGRALGETIAVALVVGSRPPLTPNLLSSGDTLAAVVVNQWGEANDRHRAALIGLSIVLLGMTLGVNLAAQRLLYRRGGP